MNETTSLPSCWIIDHNPGAVDSLCQLLQTGGYGQVLGTSVTVADWAGQRVDCLFIRITAWDNYLEWRAGSHGEGAETIIFLSGRFEKCTRHLGESLDFFFLKVDFRFRVIAFSSLLYVRGCCGGTIEVTTRDEEYTLSGSLTGFQRRLPIPWQRVNRSLLVAQYTSLPG
jgi:hypothetical protein